MSDRAKSVYRHFDGRLWQALAVALRRVVSMLWRNPRHRMMAPWVTKDTSPATQSVWTYASALPRLKLAWPNNQLLNFESLESVEVNLLKLQWLNRVNRMRVFMKVCTCKRNFTWVTKVTLAFEPHEPINTSQRDEVILLCGLSGGDTRGALSLSYAGWECSFRNK